MVRNIKKEARIAFLFFRRKSGKLRMGVLIYRAGYLDGVEFYKVKEEIGDILSKLKTSRHFPQIRYVILDCSNLNLESMELNFEKPIVLMKRNIYKLHNMDEDEFRIIKKRGYLDDGLNICKMISRIIRILP